MTDNGITGLPTVEEKPAWQRLMYYWYLKPEFSDRHFKVAYGPFRDPDPAPPLGKHADKYELVVVEGVASTVFVQ